MAPFVPNKKATFFWQGALIILPVVILAGVGFFSLRQDKVLARHEAEQRAQGLADELLPKLWGKLTNHPAKLNHHAFQVGLGGQLIFPPPQAASPLPHVLNLKDLSADQGRLWSEAQRSELIGSDQE